MSVIEKLDSVLALVAQAFDMPVRWSESGNIVPVVYTDDCEIAAVYSDREDDGCPDKAAAIIAAVNYFRDHGPAIRQDMIDARRYRWLREHSHLQDGLEFWIDPVIAIDYKPGAQLNGMHETLDAAIDARLASDSEGGE